MVTFQIRQFGGKGERSITPKIEEKFDAGHAGQFGSYPRREEKIVETLQPGLQGCADLGGERSAPFAVHPPLDRPGGLDIQGIEAGVADHPNAGLTAAGRHISRIMRQATPTS